jgi:hypothetical protein
MVAAILLENLKMSTATPHFDRELSRRRGHNCTAKYPIQSNVRFSIPILSLGSSEPFMMEINCDSGLFAEEIDWDRADEIAEFLRLYAESLDSYATREVFTC